MPSNNRELQKKKISKLASMTIKYLKYRAALNVEAFFGSNVTIGTIATW